MTRAAKRPADLAASIRVVEQSALAPFARLVAARPKNYTGGAYSRWMTRQRKVTEEVTRRLSAEGARVSESGGVSRFIFRGLAATSTMGLLGALRNWRSQAQRKLEADR